MKSTALPAYLYRDPAEVVENDEMLRLGCKACAKAMTVFGIVRCEDPRNESQKGVPRIGRRCKIYVERGN